MMAENVNNANAIVVVGRDIHATSVVIRERRGEKLFLLILQFIYENVTHTNSHSRAVD